MTTAADRHDAGKLRRWRDDLSESPDRSFPVYAMFLVSGEDKLAHNVFREFRAGFEETGAGFGNLVIFGQHGVSAAVHSMLDELGLDGDALPLLALWQESEFPRVWTVSLPAGETSGEVAETGGGGLLLEQVMRVASGASGRLDPSAMPSSRTATVAEADFRAWVSGLVDGSGFRS